MQSINVYTFKQKLVLKDQRCILCRCFVWNITTNQSDNLDFSTKFGCEQLLVVRHVRRKYAENENGKNLFHFNDRTVHSHNKNLTMTYSSSPVFWENFTQLTSIYGWTFLRGHTFWCWFALLTKTSYVSHLKAVTCVFPWPVALPGQQGRLCALSQGDKWVGK